MGWTHDHRDVTRNRNGTLRGLVPVQGRRRQLTRSATLVAEPGIPHLLRRRARWFGARLRHPRG
jgi:hypothetical protein